MNVVYDAGALVAAERDDRTMWLDHRTRLLAGVVPLVPAPVVAQVSRSVRQVQLRRLLKGCFVIGFEPNDAQEVGAALANARTSDVVDAHVVVLAGRVGAAVVTSDRRDLSRLAAAIGMRLRYTDV